jgi:uncharacterized tellurite resistance protein B-like protein
LGLSLLNACVTQSFMIDRIRNLILGGGSGEPEQANQNEPEAAAAALLVEAALIDGEFDEAERHTISQLLAERFGLATQDVEDLIIEAEAKVSQAVELHGFAKRAKDAFDHDGRIELIEMLWEVAYADGIVHDYEANLVRRLSGLLHVADRDSGAARKRVTQRLDIT